MTKKWMAISVLLFIIAGLLGWWLQASIRKFNADNDLDKLQPAQDMTQTIAQEKSLPQLPPTKSFIPEEFAVIPENNLFSESRSSGEEETEEAPQPEAQPLSEKPVLVGINITDDQKTALILDSKTSSRGENRRAQIKRIGDVFQGYTIAEIAPDHIMLESGSIQEIIPLHEGSKQTPGGKTPILTTRVVSFSGGNVSGGAPVVASATSIPGARSVPAPQSTPAVAPKPAAAPAATPIVAPATQQRAQSPASTLPTRQTRSQQVSPNTESSAPKTRVIRTPFGDIVRPVRD